jgi:protein disulfide-isomerase
MKLKTIFSLSLLALSVAAFAGDGWLTSWDDAVKLSKKTGKPILADFTGSDWCVWCKRLKAEVFDKADFKKWATQNVILLELDFPQTKQQPEALKKRNGELAKKYKIEGFPTVIFFDSKGTVLGRSGYMEGGPSAWTSNAAKLIKK